MGEKQATKKKLLFGTLGVLAFLVLLTGVFFATALLCHPNGQPKYEENDTVVTLQTDGDFTVLNLTDIQLADLENLDDFSVVKAEIDELVKRANPDLITITGDLTWSNENNISVHALIRWLDGYGIPWAPVLGNHDLGNSYNSATASGNYYISLLENAKNCLFRHGPENLGVGNYIVKVMQGDTLYKALYFIDNGNEETISDEQKAWFVQNATALEEEYGKTDGMIFMHKPLSEYRSAYYDYAYGNGNTTAKTPVVVACSLDGVDSNGFFKLLKDHQVKHVVCGHQHTNAFSLDYEGVCLTFGVKTGELSFYYDDREINLNGGTKFVFSGKETSIEWLTVDRERYHIKGSNNIAN